MSGDESATPEPSVTLAHDYLLVMRGAERAFAAIADLYGRAPIYTLLYDERGTDGRFAERRVRTSLLQHLGVGQDDFRRLLPLYPVAIDLMRLEQCEAVVSSSSAFAHGVHPPPGAVHVCYCYTPFRYAWYEQDRALAEVSPALRPALRAALARSRRWDLRASRRVDSYVAISELSRERIARYFGRDSVVIHPPVETTRFTPGAGGERLLVVSELVRHKRVHVALQAARLAGAPITIVGSGPDRENLEREFPEAEFLGRASDEHLADLYSRARAVIVPSMEEFGITAVEAQAAGRPVVAAGAGGALETVLEGRTGLFASLDDAEDFARQIRALAELPDDPLQARANADRFSVDAFQRRLDAHVRGVLGAASAAP
ncbi:MAG TPA: glycosyltransferase [Solirubrobacteraceae bacterium]|nr:glycosyltransferase [Solirubrobacteraceae bacterium]